jgi:heme-degrading monooxygenase HmoA
MILETAIRYVKKGEEQQFEHDFKIGRQYICLIDGYLEHSLRKCVEYENKY